MREIMQLETVARINLLIEAWERGATELEQPGLLSLLLGLNTYVNHDLIFDLVHHFACQSDALTPAGYARNRREFETLLTNIKRAVTDAELRLVSRGILAGDRADSWLLDDVIDGWRETLWRHIDALLRSRNETEAGAIRFQIDRRADKRADAIRRSARFNLQPRLMPQSA